VINVSELNQYSRKNTDNETTYIDFHHNNSETNFESKEENKQSNKTLIYGRMIKHQHESMITESLKARSSLLSFQ